MSTNQPPPKKTSTQPGLGEATGIPRMDSGEMKRVRESFRRDESGPESKPGAPESKPGDDGKPAKIAPPDSGPLTKDSTVPKRVRDSFRREEDDSPPVDLTKDSTVPKRVRDSFRREEEDPAPSPTPSPAPAAPTAARTTLKRSPPWGSEASTETRRKRESRPAVTVDDVGTAAVKLARTTRRDTAPKLVATRGMIAKAPIDTRAAFVLSLVDGRNSVDAIIDMSGMPAEEVKTILERLGRLGIISLP